MSETKEIAKCVTFIKQLDISVRIKISVWWWGYRYIFQGKKVQKTANSYAY